MTKLRIEYFLEWVATLPDGVCEREDDIELARKAFMAGRESVQQGVQQTASMCDCPCHVGQSIMHMWNCCDAPFSRRK